MAETSERHGCEAEIKDCWFSETHAWSNCDEDAVDFVDGHWYCLKHTPLPVEPSAAWHASTMSLPDDPWRGYSAWSPPPLPDIVAPF